MDSKRFEVSQNLPDHSDSSNQWLQGVAASAYQGVKDVVANPVVDIGVGAVLAGGALYLTRGQIGAAAESIAPKAADWLFDKAAQSGLASTFGLTERASFDPLTRNMLSTLPEGVGQGARDAFSWSIKETSGRTIPMKGLDGLEQYEAANRLWNKYPGVFIHPEADVSAARGSIGIGTTIDQGARVEANTRIGEYAAINRNAVVADRSTIGDLTVLSDGAQVKGFSTVGKESLVGRNTVVDNWSEIGHNVKIGGDAQITGRSVIGDDVQIGLGSRISESNVGYRANIGQSSRIHNFAIRPNETVQIGEVRYLFDPRKT